MQSILLVNISKSFREGRIITQAVRDASFAVSTGEVVWLRGESGSGKSTTLSVCGLLTQPDSGKLLFDDKDASRLAESDRNHLRSHEIGFIYQAHNLIPYLTALENVAMGTRSSDSRARRMLIQLGMAKRVNYRASHLSGGEQQRVAVARAIVRGPSLILADEPISGLDHETADVVLGCLSEMAASGAAVLIASHQVAVSSIATRVIDMEGGVANQ